ncbi:hypothetical protein JNJ66_03890 [Candidatus Saccharibacteria bacterium]|nr:hypothetical protein [Candidatus Saccharibacteria bacterium]
MAAAQADKNQKNGAYNQGLFMETLAIDEDNSWTAYYRKDPVKYPEIG